MPDPGPTADPTPRTQPTAPRPVGSWLHSSFPELGQLDRAVYVAVAESDTRILDAGLRRLSLAADKSKLRLGVAALLALAGGSRGRRAAVNGVVSIGVASATVNLGFKPLARRARLLRGDDAPDARHMRMPGSTSFPCGPSASAFAFAEGVGAVLQWPRPVLLLAAATVAESRVHCGVHYPGDVVAGSLIGLVARRFAATATDRARPT